MKNIIMVLFLISITSYAQKTVLVHGWNNSGGIFNGTSVETAVNDVLDYPFVI